MNSSNTFLHSLIRKLGFSAGRPISTSITGPKFAPDAADREKWLQELGIDLVIDVGAHHGESALRFLKLFPETAVYSYEPLSDCYSALLMLQKQEPRLKCFNMALGESAGPATIRRSSFSPSSSIFPMGSSHKEAFPFSANESLEDISISTLDIEYKNYPASHNVLLKVDTQGYEMHVLRGATDFIRRVRIIILELSFLNLYQGQPLFAEVYGWLVANGFAYAGSWDQLFDPRNGQPIQQDGIFIRSRDL